MQLFEMILRAILRFAAAESPPKLQGGAPARALTRGQRCRPCRLQEHQLQALARLLPAHLAAHSAATALQAVQQQHQSKANHAVVISTECTFNND